MRKSKLIGFNTLRGTSAPALNFCIALVGISCLGRQHWGEFVAVQLWVSLYAMLVNWGNKDFLLRRFSATPSRIAQLFYGNFYTRSLLLCGVFVFFFAFPPGIAFCGILMLVTLHLYSSLESLVIYEQKFAAQFAVEIVAAIAICLYLFSVTATLQNLLLAYATVNCGKTGYLLYQLRNLKAPVAFSVDSRELRLAFPFFAIGLSGWLNSKADLYIVAAALPKVELSKYQVFITAFLMLQAVSALAAVPLNRHLYRAGDATVTKVSRIFAGFSVPIAAIGTLGIYLILEVLLRLGIDYRLYLLASLSVLPAFFYVVTIVNLYRNNLEKKVMWANFAAAAVSILLTSLFISRYGLTAPVVGVVASQWFLLFILKNIRHENPAS